MSAQQTHFRSIERLDLRISITAVGERSAVMDVVGVVRRQTVDLLAVAVNSFGAAAVVVDLSGVTLPNVWLLSGLAKAHAALVARKATMRLVIDDDEVFGLLNAAGFNRLSPVLLTRRFGDHLDARSPARRNRTSDRQRVIDLTAGRAHARSQSRIQVLTARPARWPVRGTAASLRQCLDEY